MEYIELQKPRVNIELYGSETSITPIDKVHVMDEDSFEQFTLEWLYGCKKTEYSSIKIIGGAGDKGRDIIALSNDGSVDYYQCKHYTSPLTPTNYYLEFGKLCYYTYNKEIKIPKNYFIIASNDIGPSLQDLLIKPDTLCLKLKENWDKHCKNKITSTTEIALDTNLSNYIDSFDFSIIKTYPIQQIINEYLDTPYGVLRFGGRSLDIPDPILPNDTIEQTEMTYIAALLEAYSEELNVQINTIESLKSYDTYYNHFNRQRKDYYAAETIRRFVRNTLTDSKQFDILKKEILNGIIDTHEQNYNSGYDRLTADLIQAAQINTSKCILDSKYHCIGTCERKGTCHILANEDEIRWVDKK